MTLYKISLKPVYVKAETIDAAEDFFLTGDCNDKIEIDDIIEEEEPL